MALLLFTFAFSFLVSVLITPRVREHARKRGILDLPDRERKLHARETPLGGGFAVFLAAIISTVFVFGGLLYAGWRKSVSDAIRATDFRIIGDSARGAC